jgi:hypothetical protein
MGPVESHMGQEDTLIADPYKELHDVSNKIIDKSDLDDWLELQEQAKTHDRQMKELAASHREDQQWSVQAKANDGGVQRKWDPTNKPTRW